MSASRTETIVVVDAKPTLRETVIPTVLGSMAVRSFLAGTLTGVCSTFLFQPLDLVKTRIQSQLVAGVPQSAITSFKVIPIVTQILRQENIFGLWRGTVPSLFRTVPGVGIYFTSIHIMQEMAGPGRTSTETMLIGVASRVMASLSVLPFTVIKARYESGLFQYSSVFGAFKSTVMTEGFRSLYSGIIPTLLRDAPFSGIYLMFYEMLKSRIKSHLPESNWTPVTHFSAGLAAGLLASIVTHPFDVIKTQIQLTSDPRQRRLLTSARSIWARNGMRGYFAGLFPRIARRTLMTATSWTVYEQAKQRLFGNSGATSGPPIVS
ncbi:hypothetical protein RvY_04073-2 [Ramazzottius varieornatus]|uniref:Mitochondrial glycine transporter n=1 Tax=Ramazzottius varieornatus TaxID=947166 RepID=A0A1D1UQA8_RAMVA|nr:hypothetical protein RvY_04073-2 [Ramazzottius varieornatus]